MSLSCADGTVTPHPSYAWEQHLGNSSLRSSALPVFDGQRTSVLHAGDSSFGLFLWGV